ncbi:MAG: hypothetical protein CME71_05205 [Halobacteriovorax sp.]|nr:hypothetical protein [Halobacteriovorax sp.]
MIAIKKNPLVLAFRRFMFLRGTTLAAASSFYFMLTIVPMVLLVVRAIGFIFGDLAGALEHVFLVVQNFFPGLTGGFLTTVRELVETALFGSVKITLFNLFVLLVGSLSFVNSLWTGVYLITEDRSFLSWRNYVRAIVLLGFSSIFVTLLFLIPSFFVSVINFLQTNQTLVSVFEAIQLPREYFLELAIIDIDKNFLLKSDFLALTLFIIYFTFTFRFVFKSRLKWRDALLSASGFSLGLLLMKRTFWLYLEASKHSLMSSYGKAYTLVLGTLWIYLGMCLFFLMVSLACELSSRRRALDAQTSKGYHGDTFEGEQN